MKNRFYILLSLIIFVAACKDDENRLFDKTADERVAEAIAALKADLVSAPNGWKVIYKPESESGSFFVVMKFDNDNNVSIKTDLSSNEGEYFQKTVKYRIDNSLGLEVIIENYSFFSFLFEQDQATFGAEYEFNYVNKTPDNDLVFQSKSDVGVPTIITFQQATAQDEGTIGTVLSTKLGTLAQDLDKITSSLRLSLVNKDLALYVSLDDLRRTIRISTASLVSNTASTQSVNFTSGYRLENDDFIFETPLSANILGKSVTLERISFAALSDASIDVCAAPIPIHRLQGTTSTGEPVTMETSLLDVGGKRFATVSNFYFSPLQYIFDNGFSAQAQIEEDIKGAVELDLYYNAKLKDGTTLTGIGFIIINEDDSATLAIKEFVPTLIDNNIRFAFKPGFRILGKQQTTANLDNIDIYLNKLAEGDNTFVFEIREDLYEFYNPCTKWSFVFVNGNQ